jgi:ferrous iron transport protein B
VILLALILAIPASEIVIPTVIMGYMNLGRMTEIDNPALLFQENGWTLLTAVCLMLFSVLQYPCTTTARTIWDETRSVRWTLLANLLPLALALVVCFVVAQAGFWFAGIAGML